MAVFMPLLIINKAMAQVNVAFETCRMKYMLVFLAHALTDTPLFKSNHPDAWAFFTDQPTSIGFQASLQTILLSLLAFFIIVSMGAQIKDMIGYFKTLLCIFQAYSFFTFVSFVNISYKYGLKTEGEGINIFVL